MFFLLQCYRQMWTPVALKINCGYARTAIREITHELTQKKNGLSLSKADKATRSTAIQSSFLHLTCHQLCLSLMGHTIRCLTIIEALLNMFKKKWHPQTKRIEYDTFSIANWKLVTEEKKREYTLSNYIFCSKEFPNYN